MPLLENITIHSRDMQKILEALASKQHFGHIKIIDAKFTWNIRDLNEACITEVKKSQEPVTED